MKTKEEILSKYFRSDLPESKLIFSAMEENEQEVRKEHIELYLAAAQILHLHLCEQKLIVGEQPTPDQWWDAFERLSNALYQNTKNQKP